MKPAILANLFEQAAASPMGIVIETDNTEALKWQLATYRRTEGGIATQFSICLPSDPTLLFITPRNIELDDPYEFGPTSQD